MMQWFYDNKLPFGRWMANLIDWMVDSGSLFFDAISDNLADLIHGLTGTLLWFPPLVLIAVFTAITYAVQRRRDLQCSPLSASC